MNSDSKPVAKVTFDASQLVGFAQVARVAEADAPQSLEQLGRLLCKRGEVPL